MYHQQDEIDKERLLKDKQFLRDARVFLAQREGYEADDLISPEDVYDRYMEHFRFQNVNEVTAVNDLLYAQNADDEGKERMARLMQTYDKMDSDLGLTAAGDYVAGVLTAPSTYAGIFTGGGAKVGSLAAQQGVKLGIRQLLKKGASGQALRQAATQGAVRAGAVEGTIGAGQVLAQEETRVETGMQDEVRGGMIALGAAAGAVPGSIFGAGSQVQRAIAENTAERVMKITEMTASRATRLANQTATKDVFEDEATGETANLILRELKQRKASLATTVPEELEQGKRLKKELAPDDAEVADVPISPKPKLPLEASVENKNLQNIAAVAAKIVQSVPDLPPGMLKENEVETFTSKLVRALRSGDMNTQRLEALAKQHAIKFSDIGALLAAEVSNGASLMGKIGALSRAQKKTFAEQLDEIDTILLEAAEITSPAKQALDEIDDQIGKGTLAKANDALNNINKARIGLMTVQLATTARNMTNGYMRNIVYGYDNLGAGLYNTMFSSGAAKGRLKRAGNFEPTAEEIKQEAERAVKLGMAQLRTARDSFLFKDLFGITTAETTALTRLMQSTEFGKSEAAKRLFMEMGDVAEHTNMDGKLLGLARKLNKLNTLSDNMFKRAILSREMDKAIRAAGYEDGLNGVLKAGRFMDIPEEVIAKGMNQALDFTYQTGKFKGREGVFNDVADTFIRASQTKLGSTFVPFPRYLVNQFRFLYEHTPVLGMMNVGGILNESGKAGRKAFFDFEDERIGKQLGGLMMLTGLYALREDYGDETTGPFEYKNPFGSGLVDAQASLGPFSAHAFAADAIWRYFNTDKVTRPAEIRDFVKSIGGGQFRPTGLGLVDGLFDTWQKGIDDGELDIKLEEMGARFIGNYMNTFTVGAGVLKDVVATLDPEMRVVADNTDIRFLPYIFKQATRSFPRDVDESDGFFFGRKQLQSPTRTDPIRIMNPFMRQLTGLTQQEERTYAEREFDRLGLDYTQIAPRRMKGGIGSADLTTEAKEEMARFVEGAISDYIMNDPEYRNMPEIVKKATLPAYVGEFRGEARARVLDLDRYTTVEDMRRVARAKYFDIPTKKRDLIAHYYKGETGLDLADSKDYLTALYIKEQRGL